MMNKVECLLSLCYSYKSCI